MCADTAPPVPLLQTRASRLSFNDIVKRLAQQPEDAPTFISKRVCMSTVAHDTEMGNSCHFRCGPSALQIQLSLCMRTVPL